MSEIFNYTILYRQLIVFDTEPEEPWNDWTDQHVAQGFSWREGRSVSFQTLEDLGKMRVEVINAKEIMVDPKASIAIVVPFTVKNSKELGFSDTAHVGRITIISEGNYALLYETG